MKIGFVVNEIATEKTNYSTTHLALAALKRGHDVHYIEVADFVLDPDEMVHAHAYKPPSGDFKTASSFFKAMRSREAVKERITVDTLDVLMLRNDPARADAAHAWARSAAMNFGRLALRHGVIVLNDPDGLSRAANKMYLEQFPKSVRPRSTITRSPDDIKAFIRSEGGTIVLKPLAGSGGHNVFLLGKGEPNVNQIIEAVVSEDYALAQEYLPAASEGDIRLFMMNGQIFEHEGKIGAIHRRGATGDIRNNLTVGGRIAKVKLTDRLREIAETVRPRLVKDGMFLVGLDVVEDKLMEINVFSPGGLVGASKLNKISFVDLVIDALERKVALFGHDPRRFTNAEIATM
jgi:glutathione synthase